MACQWVPVCGSDDSFQVKRPESGRKKLLDYENSCVALYGYYFTVTFRETSVSRVGDASSHNRDECFYYSEI